MYHRALDEAPSTGNPGTGRADRATSGSGEVRPTRDGAAHANRGRRSLHSTFSAAELFAALYYAELRYRPDEPDWPDRDRFVLSKGHAAIGLYPLLADVGFFDRMLLDDYTRLDSSFGDHPDMRKIAGIDFSSGSLGHGLSVSVGMALGARVQGRSFRVYCMMDGGELAEGQIWEAAMAASQFQLGSLVGIVDRNHLSIDGNTESLMSIEPLAERFASFGWKVHAVDGHDLDAILD